MKISIGNDHAGVDHKTSIVNYLENLGYEVVNHGTDIKKSVDYPDYIHPVACDVENGVSNFGVVICGSGNGAAMTANKHKRIRAALCWNVEIVGLARVHNNANVLSIPARFVSVEESIKMVDVFLRTPFESGRHQNRIDKITCR